jgi:DNA segregation ATPase FtsK/SpoIIIE-like protein
MRRERLMVEAAVVDRPWLRAVQWAGRRLSRWRFELATALMLGVAYVRLAGSYGAWPVRLVGVGVAAAVLAWPTSRRLVLRRFAHSRVRRQFLAGARRVGLVIAEDVVPFVGRVRDVPAGERLALRVPPGCTADRMQGAAETLAVCLRVRDVRVKRAADDASRVWLTVVRRDPLAASVPLPWPAADTARMSLWEPVPVGVDEDGRPVTVSLPERNVLLGGEPGGGKSVAHSQLVAAAALDPDVDLYLFDGKRVELAGWAPSAAATVGPDVQAANDVLDELVEEMDRRYELLLSRGRRKIERGDLTRLVVVVVDELAFYTAGGADRAAKALRAGFAERLHALVARGRAAGIIVLAATQKPAADIVPTYLRDLFGFRWALRCSTPQASDTILGQGWASAGCSATDVPAEARGVGYLLAEGGQPVRLRSYHLDDDTLAGVAARAAALRSGRSAAAPGWAAAA